MGLDISYYRNIRPGPEGLNDEAVEDWVCNDWANRFRYGPNDDSYSQRLDEVSPGLMEGEGSGSFRAGSYSGYNRWRETLSMAILKVMPRIVWQNPERYTEAPFSELINFSDCEGEIGPMTSRKLAADFERHRDEFYAYTDDDYDRTRYENFATAFKVAGYEHGCVSFH